MIGNYLYHQENDSPSDPGVWDQHAILAVMSILWHPDAAEGIVEPSAVMAIGKWCESKLQAVDFQAGVSTEHVSLLKALLPILAAISSKLLKPNTVAAFLSANEGVLEALMRTKELSLEACRLVLLSLRPLNQANQKYKTLRFHFFQVFMVEVCALYSQRLCSSLRLW